MNTTTLVQAFKIGSLYIDLEHTCHLSQLCFKCEQELEERIIEQIQAFASLLNAINERGYL